MSEHPIEGLMKTAMESIKEMVDVNTVVGDPVETPDGTIIIPITRVACGFAAGGGEFELPKDGNQPNQKSTSVPFGGGSGAGVSVQPVGFLVVGHNQVRLIPVDGNAMVDRIIDMAPQLVDQIKSIFNPQQHESEQFGEQQQY